MRTKLVALPSTETLNQPAGALFDADRVYRYLLWRTWSDGPRIVWLLLNPSTADEERLDPTLTRCRDYAERWGFGGMDVLNLFALRSTDPAGLYQVVDPVGPANDDITTAILEGAELVVAGWGAEVASPRARRTPVVRERPRAVCDLAARLERKSALQCLGTTASGEPRHPLYLKKAEILRRYRR